MAIDFPNSPTVGQIFTSGDKSWIWDGTVWKAYGASLSPTVLKVDSTNSRVGINNQSPATALDIVGTTTVRAASTQDGVALAGRAGGTSTYEVTLTPTTLTADRTLTLPDATGTVALTSDPGLVYITGTTVTSGSSTTVVFNNCFSSTYDNYRIIIDNFFTSTGNRGLNLRLRASGSDATGSNYNNVFHGLTMAAAASNFTGTTDYASTGVYNSSNTLGLSHCSMDVFSPNKAERTYAQVQSILYDSQWITRNGLWQHDLTTAYDGFTLLLSSTGNITQVRVRVYGYRNS